MKYSDLGVREDGTTRKRSQYHQLMVCNACLYYQRSSVGGLLVTHVQAYVATMHHFSNNWSTFVDSHSDHRGHAACTYPKYCGGGSGLVSVIREVDCS